MTVPAGQVIAMAHAPAMEWLTWMNWQLNCPSWTVSLGCTTCIGMPSTRYSFSFRSTSAIVSLVPYICEGACFKI